MLSKYSDTPMDKYERQLQAIKSFKRWFEELVFDELSDEELMKLYDSPIKLMFYGREIELPFAAQTYEATVDLLQEAIDEY